MTKKNGRLVENASRVRDKRQPFARVQRMQMMLSSVTGSADIET